MPYSDIVAYGSGMSTRRVFVKNSYFKESNIKRFFVSMQFTNAETFKMYAIITKWSALLY